MNDITGVDDATLLRALAEDIPGMALTVRNQLRMLAQRLSEGHWVGHVRCKRCGEFADITISKTRSEWQPIETAPKDGTYLLLWWPHWYAQAGVGYFEHGHWHAEYALSDEVGPTHWMRLPAPPVVANQGE